MQSESAVQTSWSSSFSHSKCFSALLCSRLTVFISASFFCEAFITPLFLPITSCQTLRGCKLSLLCSPICRQRSNAFQPPRADQQGPSVLVADVDTVCLSISWTLELGFNLKAAGVAACEYVQPLALSIYFQWQQKVNQGLILYQTCCSWLHPDELHFPGLCCRVFPASPFSPVLFVPLSFF